MKSNYATTLVLMTATLLSVTASAEDKTTNAPARPLAVFVNDPAKGKDPFFPDSTRRIPAVTQAAPASTNSAPAFVPASIPFQLKGISGTRGQRLALVNNTTLAIGESAEVRASGHAVKILLREIRERSVLIEIVSTGEVKEIKLREGI